MGLQRTVAVALTRAARWLDPSTRPSHADLQTDPTPLEMAEAAAGFGVWETDPTRQWTTLSASAARLSGYPAVATRMSLGDLLGLIHPEDLPSVVEASEHAIDAGSSFESEFRVRLADGSYRWRRSRGRVESVAGRPSRIVGAIVDIDEEKQILERLNRNAERMTLAEDVARFGVFEVDVATNLMTLSPGAAALSGFDRAAMQRSGSDVIDRIETTDRPKVLAAIERALRTGEPYRVECRVALADGTLRARGGRGWQTLSHHRGHHRHHPGEAVAR